MTLKNVIYILKETRPFSDIGTADADRWVKTRERLLNWKGCTPTMVLRTILLSTETKFKVIHTLSEHARHLISYVLQKKLFSI